jgi:hypothetical protein
LAEVGNGDLMPGTSNSGVKPLSRLGRACDSLQVIEVYHDEHSVPLASLSLVRRQNAAEGCGNDRAFVVPPGLHRRDQLLVLPAAETKRIGLEATCLAIAFDIEDVVRVRLAHPWASLGMEQPFWHVGRADLGQHFERLSVDDSRLAVVGE